MDNDANGDVYGGEVEDGDKVPLSQWIHGVIKRCRLVDDYHLVAMSFMNSLSASPLGLPIKWRTVDGSRLAALTGLMLFIRWISDCPKQWKEIADALEQERKRLLCARPKACVLWTCWKDAQFELLDVVDWRLDAVWCHLCQNDTAIDANKAVDT
ncbi:hypothetical protein ml_335 [Mollivirus sibericum]|uniref:hypothetical protein n=1 Tax=Mollivirus sibericum TaxID=1678078 RepID=UPI0006B2DC2C|nr:hypothetical protein ml_335 [Mollivirus sibericum]ALD62137.1 hypothetical protein ml_335 [Mollivirus sibericum]